MNKYDIDLKQYENKKAIGHYDIMISNAVYNSILCIDVIYKYGDMVMIYKTISSNENNKNNNKLHYARINEKSCLTVIDAFNKKHCISYNQFLVL